MVQPAESVLSALKFPGDLIYGEMLLSFIGRQAVLIENYRNLLIYTDTLIKIQAKNSRLSITGSRLSIEYYDKEEMKITGQIKKVEFE